MASTANTVRFWKEAACAQLAQGQDVFWFEAFDEPNKPIDQGKNSQHWGTLTVDRQLKYDLTC